MTSDEKETRSGTRSLGIAPNGEALKYLIVLAVAALIFAAAVDFSLNNPSLKAGGDYALAVPALIQGRLFFRAQGLLAPQYSAQCAGMPYFANPGTGFYSVQQFLAFFFPVWTAVRAGSVVTILLSAFSMYALAKKGFGLSLFASLLAGVFFATCSLLPARLFVGHLGFHTLAFFPLAMCLLLYEEVSDTLSAVTVGLIGGYFFLSGSVHVCVIAALSAPLVISLAWTIRTPGPLPMRRLAVRTAAAAVIALLLSCSKLLASAALMSRFPRTMPLDQVSSLALTMRMMVSQLFGMELYQPLPYGDWEYRLMLCPLVLWGFVKLLGSLRKPSLRRLKEKFVPLFIFILAVLLTVNVVAGTDSASSLLRHLGLGAVRVNPRYTAALIVPIVLLGSLGLDSYRLQGGSKALIIIAATVWGILSVLPFRLDAFQYPLSVDLRDHVPFDELSFIVPTAELGPREVTLRPVPNMTALTERKTSVQCYEPLYFTGRPQSRNLKEGSILEISEGHFNLLNPSCLLYPNENHCSPGDLIAKSDRENLLRLLSYQNPTWSMPPAQRVANGLSLITLLASLLVVLWQVFLAAKGRAKSGL